MLHSGPSSWQAMASPIRRRLVDLLAGGPRTTGDLAGAFAVSRFAVMKHLGVLERAGVTASRRQGRARWHWLLGEGSAIAGKGAWTRGAESGTRQGPGAAGTVEGLRTFSVECEVSLDAEPSRVFDALTLDVSAWWGAPFLRSPSATGMVLEGHLGGRFYEEWGHRQGVILGVVSAIRRDERIEISGNLGRERLPATLEFVLSRRAGRTHLRVTHRGLAVAGADSGSPAPVCEAAWRELLADRLKAFVERGVRVQPGRPATGIASPF